MGNDDKQTGRNGNEEATAKDSNRIDGADEENPEVTSGGALEELTGLNFIPSAAKVQVHPLVLLSLVDHYARMNNRAAQNKRVVGLLLGRYKTEVADSDKDADNFNAKNKFDTASTRASELLNNRKKNERKKIQILDINNSFAVPFDEDPTNPDVWFFDTNYAEEMFHMYKRVIPGVRIVGWYSSGDSVQKNDLLLHLLIADRFCPNPVYCVVKTDEKNKGVPVLAYTTVQGRRENSSGDADSKTNFLEFRNIPTHLAAEEAEEIGIEHLLRDLTDSTITTLSTQVQEKELSLLHLCSVLQQIEEYLKDVVDQKLPINEDVLEVLQEIISLQPEIYLKKTSTEMIRDTNDRAISTFLAATARCIGALHDVILNRRSLARELQEIREKRAKAEQEKQLANEKSMAEEALKESGDGKTDK